MNLRTAHRLAGWLALAALVGVAPAGLAESADEKLLREVRLKSAAYARTRGADVAISIRDAATGKGLLDLTRAPNSAQPMIPASNQKILTAAYVLTKTGPADRTLKTTLYRHGEDLVLTGDWDPTLGDPILAGRAKRSIYARLDELAAAARTDFGRTRPGKLLLVVPRDPGRCPDWPANQARSWYAAPPGPLNFHDNCIDVAFRVDDARPDRIVTLAAPQSRLIRYVPKVKPGRKHNWGLLFSGDESVITVRGTIGLKRGMSEPLSTAVSDPEMLLGRVLHDRLARAGVEPGAAPQVVRALPRGELKKLAVIESPLADALNRANKRSLNLAAECLLLRTGGGTWKSATQDMKATLVKQFGLDERKLTIADGSGLGRSNRVQAGDLCLVLHKMLTHRDAQLFLRSLPRSGYDGSLAGRLDDAGAKGRVLAKTGTLSGCYSLSGYVLDGDYRVQRVFSILINGASGGARPARAYQDAVVRAILAHVDAGSRQ